MLFTDGKHQAFEHMMRQPPRCPLHPHRKPLPKPTPPPPPKSQKEKPHADHRPLA